MLRIIGAILMIAGTSIGGAMLSLPMATAAGGYFPSIGFLVLAWMAMTFGAVLIMEVNFWLPKGSNMITMARQTLGVSGELITWFVYLSLLYCLLAAYLAGGSDLVNGLLSFIHIHLTHALDLLIFLFLFGTIAFLGIQSVDWVNRGIMFLKLMSFFLLALCITPYFKVSGFVYNKPSALLVTVMTMITSYGFAIIVPSIRSYFNDNHRKIRIAVYVGSLVPLFCYIIWQTVIFASLPRTGQFGLVQLMHSAHPITDLMVAIEHISQQGWVHYTSTVFTSVCIITAFLGVSLCLLDFLSDGMRVKNEGVMRVIIALIAFVPSAVLILYVPKLFLAAINFAGILCVILLMLIPALMAFCGRNKAFVLEAQKQAGMGCVQKFIFHPLVLVSYIIISLGVLVLGIGQLMG